MYIIDKGQSDATDSGRWAHINFKLHLFLLLSWGVGGGRWDFNKLKCSGKELGESGKLISLF